MNGFMSNERYGCSIESGLFHCEIADTTKLFHSVVNALDYDLQIVKKN